MLISIESCYVQFSHLKNPKDVHGFSFFFAKDAGFETPAKVEASRLLLRLVRGSVDGQMETIDSHQVTLK